MKRSIFLSLIYNVFSIVYQGFSFDFFSTSVFLCFIDVFSPAHQCYNGSITVHLKSVSIVGGGGLHLCLLNCFAYFYIFPFAVELYNQIF